MTTKKRNERNNTQTEVERKKCIMRTLFYIECAHQRDEESERLRASVGKISQAVCDTMRILSL